MRGPKTWRPVATGRLNIANTPRGYHSPNVDFLVAISHVFLSLLSYTPLRLFWLVSLGVGAP